MIETSVEGTQSVDVIEMKVAEPDSQVPDLHGIVQAAVGIALEYCAQKSGVGYQQALMNLGEGDRTTCGYYRYRLAREVARRLGMLDETIRAIYILDYDATPEDMCFCESRADPVLHLIIWVERRTGALDALATAMDRALVQCHRDLLGASRLRRLLDAQVVDDADVRARLGYGALLNSIHHRPVSIWERGEGL